MAKFTRPNLSLVALSLVLCVHLVKVTPVVAAYAIQDSLPALVLDEEPPAGKSGSAPAAELPASTQSSGAPQAASSSSAPEEPAKPQEPAKPAEAPSEAPKLIPYETTKEAPASEATTTQAAAAAAPTSEPPKQQETNTSQKSSPKEEEKVSGESGNKDLNVLLANKDDAENDLAASPTASESAKPSVVVTSVTTETKLASPADEPVETSKPSQASNDNRFHYAFGSTDKNGESSDESSGSEESDSSTTTTTTTAAPTEAPLPSTEAPKVEEPKKPLDLPAAAPTAEESVKPVAPVDKVEEKLEGKKVEYDDKTKSVVTSEASESPKDAKRVDEIVPKVDLTTSASTTEASPSSESPVVKELPSSSAKPEAPSSTTAAPPATSSVTAATAAKSNDTKPAVPSILAVALGTALSAATNPLGSKDKPVVAAASPAASPIAAPSSTTTTKAPASTTRKSTTDKWDRWNPTSSTPSPTRRRPILPSIRRRFRPYNRFSPFPWNNGPNVDSYTPFGHEPAEFMPSEPRPSPPGHNSLKPRRHQNHSPTLEPAVTRSGEESSFSSTSAPSSGSSPAADDEAGSNSTARPSRRPGSSHRRRHHHTHHHTHNHNHEHHHHNDGPSVTESTPTSRRRGPPHHPRRQHHHRRPHFGDSDKDGDYPASSNESPTLSGPPSPFGSESGLFGAPASQGPRPFAPGFGLFNSVGSSTGSGFDLLNPFSSWLDDFAKPRPPVGGASGSHHPRVPPLGSSGGRPVKPVIADGEYDERPGASGSHGEHHHQHGPHGHNGHNGRDDYDPHHDHNHRHDCHEHDYDHDHEYHHRPHRDREPYRPVGGSGYEGGYGGGYGSGYGGGRRPTGGRPYIRSGEAGSSSNNSGETEHSEASPSLYAPWKANASGSASSSSSVGPSSGSRSPVELIPRRVPSLLSPFDSLFSSLDEDLFSLRSSFIGSPGGESTQTFDAVVSSPKIVLPGSSVAAPSRSDRVVEPIAVVPSSEDKPKPQSSDVEDQDDFLRRSRALGRSPIVTRV